MNLAPLFSFLTSSLYFELICELFCFILFGFSRMPVVCSGYTYCKNALIPVAIGYLFSCKTKLSCLMIQITLWVLKFSFNGLAAMILFLAHSSGFILFCFLMAHSKLSIRPCRNHSLCPWKSSQVLLWTSVLLSTSVFPWSSNSVNWFRPVTATTLISTD